MHTVIVQHSDSNRLVRDPLKFFHAGWLLAWILGAVAIGGAGINHGSRAFLSLTLPAGLIITLLGVLTLIDYRHMRQELDQYERGQVHRYLMLPFFRFERGFNRWMALGVLVIGL